MDEGGGGPPSKKGRNEDDGSSTPTEVATPDVPAGGGEKQPAGDQKTSLEGFKKRKALVAGLTYQQKKRLNNGSAAANKELAAEGLGDTGTSAERKPKKDYTPRVGMATVLGLPENKSRSMRRYIEGAPSEQFCTVMSHGTLDEIRNAAEFHGKRHLSPLVRDSPKLYVYPIHLILQNENLSGLECSRAINAMLTTDKDETEDMYDNIDTLAVQKFRVPNHPERTALWLAVALKRDLVLLRFSKAVISGEEGIAPEDTALFQALPEDDSTYARADILLKYDVYNDAEIDAICRVAIDKTTDPFCIGYCLAQLVWRQGDGNEFAGPEWIMAVARFLKKCTAEETKELVKGAMRGHKKRSRYVYHDTIPDQLWRVLGYLVTAEDAKGGTAGKLIDEIVFIIIKATDGYTSGRGLSLDQPLGFELMKATIMSCNVHVFDALMDFYDDTEDMSKYFSGGKIRPEMKRVVYEEGDSPVLASFVAAGDDSTSGMSLADYMHRKYTRLGANGDKEEYAPAEVLMHRDDSILYTSQFPDTTVEGPTITPRDTLISKLENARTQSEERRTRLEEERTKREKEIEEERRQRKKEAEEEEIRRKKETDARRKLLEERLEKSRKEQEALAAELAQLQAV